MKLFIGSSREALDLVRQIEVWLEPLPDVHTLPWDTPGLFEPGEQTLQSLLSIAKTVDAAIFLFSEDDKVWYRDDSVPQPRDNVLIEYGLFVGTLGMKRAIICTDGQPKLAVDVRGLTYVDLSAPVRKTGRYNLLTWGKKITVGREDPEAARLRDRVREVERNNEQLASQISTLTGIVEDLKSLSSAKEKVNFSQYDLAKDGHWKLLFDYQYFKNVAAGIEGLVYQPSALKEMLVENGAAEIANRIAWHLPDCEDLLNNNPEMSGWFSKKVLRLFRDHSGKDLFLQFVKNAPPKMRKVFEEQARIAIEEERQSAVRRTLQPKA